MLGDVSTTTIKKESRCKWFFGRDPSIKYTLPILEEGLPGTDSVVNKLPLPKKYYWLLFGLVLAVFGCGLLLLGYFTINTDTSIGPSQNFGWTNYYWTNRSKIDDNCGVLGATCPGMLSNSSWSPGRCTRFAARTATQASVSRAVIGSGHYHPKSLICSAAVHSGAITDGSGGCFKFRFSGAQEYFEATNQNDVQSVSFGWFPGSMEFAALDDGDQCNMIRPWADFYIAIGVFLIVILLRPPAVMSFFCIILTAFEYLVATDVYGTPIFVQSLSAYSINLFSLIMTSILLWMVAGNSTVPEPRKFPLDFYFLYFLPFWGGIHMDDFTLLGIDVAFSSKIFSSSGLIVGFILLMVVGIPCVCLQARLWFYSSKRFFVWVTIIIVVILCIAIFAAIFNKYISLHFHHWIVGTLAFLFFQGQPKFRYSIILQGIFLGVMVNGFIVWGVAALFESQPSSGSGASSYWWTGVNISDTSVTMQWAKRTTVLNYCNGTIPQFPSPVVAYNPLFSDQTAVHDRNLANLIQGDSFSPMTLTMNGLVTFQGYLDYATEDSFTFTQENLTPGYYYQFAAGSSSYISLSYLFVNMSLPNMYYNVSDPKYDNICNRVGLLQDLSNG